MGKRSAFERVKGDFYPTPFSAVEPLFPFLRPGQTFIEPCAGDGRLIRHLQKAGLTCVYACDIDPQGEGIYKRDVLSCQDNNLLGDGFRLPPADLIITNPPWERNEDGTGPLHEMITMFSDITETWLLFDADWKETKQATQFKHLCRDIIPVGRVKWIEDSKGAGKENAAWYRFSNMPGRCVFHFR